MSSVETGIKEDFLGLAKLKTRAEILSGKEVSQYASLLKNNLDTLSIELIVNQLMVDQMKQVDITKMTDGERNEFAKKNGDKINKIIGKFYGFFAAVFFQIFIENRYESRGHCRAKRNIKKQKRYPAGSRKGNGFVCACAIHLSKHDISQHSADLCHEGCHHEKSGCECSVFFGNSHCQLHRAP